MFIIAVIMGVYAYYIDHYGSRRVVLKCVDFVDNFQYNCSESEF